MEGSLVRSEPRQPNPDLLSGWKQVGAYLGRGPRTAQRWERVLGLPVHRLRTTHGMAVYGLKGEIDGWLRESRHWCAPPSTASTNILRSRPPQAAPGDEHTMGQLAASLALAAVGLGSHGASTNGATGLLGTIRVRHEHQLIVVEFSVSICRNDGLPITDEVAAGDSKTDVVAVSTAVSRKPAHDRPLK